MRSFATEVTVVNPPDPSKSATVECLVNIRAACSQLPSGLLHSLGITHFDGRPCIFADERRGFCRVGRAEFIYARLADIAGLIVLLGGKRRVAEVGQEEAQLLSNLALRSGERVLY
jgi:hypothetical protein